MADLEASVNRFFAGADTSLSQDVMTELIHILKLMSLSPEDLYYKWDSYVITMGTETTKLDYKTVRDFKKTLQEAFERDSRKTHATQNNSKRVTATPRTGSGGGDVFGMLDGMVSNTPANRGPTSAKRKATNFDTPSSKSARGMQNTSPAPARNGAGITFEHRTNSGDTIESLNSHLPACAIPDVPPTESRIKLRAAVDVPKFGYRPMAMKLSEASEILDDRIDTFTERLQEHHQLSDSVFGNPAAQSTAEIVAVGRIACDSSNGRLNAASMVLETSRRMGAGLRVPLRFEGIGYDVFPGKIVGVRGTNVSGEYFAATEILEMPRLAPAASKPMDLDVHNDRMTGADGETRPLNVLIASGPYTTETGLSFSPLYALLDKAENEKSDLLILSGPFLDLEHPVVASGDFEEYLPEDAKIEPDRATINDVFRNLIGLPIQRLVQAVPTITIVLVPSVRDAISKHISWPQDRVPKQTLGLPRQVQFVANPMTLQINETVLGITSQDILSELRRENVHQAAKGQSTNADTMGRLANHLIEQSHYFPVFPPAGREELPKPTDIPGEVPEPGDEPRFAIGANIDMTYYKLGEFCNVKPDILVIPSVLNPFAKVLEGVVCINPGTLSKKRGAGTFAALSVQPRMMTEDEREQGEIAHNIYDRARVDITRV